MKQKPLISFININRALAKVRLGIDIALQLTNMGENLPEGRQQHAKNIQ